MIAKANPGQDIIGFLIARTALCEGVSAVTTEKVIRHQFYAASAATQQNNTVEISGLGYLYISERKMKAKLARARKILDAYNIKLTQQLTDARRASLLRRIDSITSQIERYEGRLERTCTGNV